MSIFFIIIFQFFASVVLSLFINLFGLASKKFGYVNLADIQAEGLLGYNLIFRVLAPTVYIAFLSIILYFIGVEKLVENIWLIALWYALINVFILIFLGRFSLINKPLYFLIQIVAIIIAYLLNKISFSHGLQAILPDASNFRTELWMILLIFFYSVLNSYQPSPSNYYERKERYVKSLYASLKNRYNCFLFDEIKNNLFLEKLFFSIMIVEVINRNNFLRFVERILYPMGFIKTTGVMQIKSDKFLSDEESMNLAQNKIKDSYSKHENSIENNHDLAKEIVNDYNAGYHYFDTVMNIFNTIDINNLLNISRKNKAQNTTINGLDSTQADTLKREIKDLLIQMNNLGIDISDILPK